MTTDPAEQTACEICGTPFPSKPRKKYCSGKCGDLAYNRTRREKMREYSRQWRKDNADRAHATAKAYREANRGKENDRIRRWRNTPKGRESTRETIRRWNERNPEWRTRDRAMRAKAEAEGDATPELIEQKWEDGDQCCCVCGDLIDPAIPAPDPKSRTVEHDLPISRGGRHDLDNIYFSHMACNSRKGNKTVVEYLDWLDDPIKSGTYDL